MTEELRAALDELTRAVAEGDVAAADALLADDFVLTSSGGVAPRVARADWLEALARLETTLFTYEPVETRVFADVAAVVARVTWEARLGERDLSGDYAITDVLTRRDGRWRPTWRISTRLGGPEA